MGGGDYSDLIEEVFFWVLDRVDIVSSALQSVPWRHEISFFSKLNHTSESEKF